VKVFSVSRKLFTLEKTQKIIPLTTNKDGKENEVSFAIIEGNGGFLLESGGGRNRLSFMFRRRNISRGNMKSPIVIRILGYGYSEGFFSLKKVVIFHCGGSDCNMIHITLTFYPDDDGGFHITTAANISTLEKTQKIIPLTTNKDGKENEVSFVIIGELAGDYSGYSVSSAGDVNGDGLDDLIVGTGSGKSYVVFGT
jgi:hypothetical protein